MKRTKLLFVMLIVASLVIFSCSDDSTGPVNAEPEKPSNPIPEDNETDLYPTTISWDCVDPEDDPLTYDVYFGTSSNPALANSGQNETTYDPGTLNEETTYYWKIVVHDDNSNSTTGDIWQFTTTSGIGTVTDIDGNVYQTLIIGDQEWMIENLKVTHYRNGDPIPNVTDGNQWSNFSAGAYCYYNNNSANGNIYGVLYNWYAVDDSRNIAPEGWHVPTDEEIKELEMYLGMDQNQADDTGWRGTNEGSKLADRSDLWDYGNLENNSEFDISGFDFLPGGYRSNDGGFFNTLGIYGSIWSSSESSSTSAWRRFLNCYYSGVNRNYHYNKPNGFSVRCVRD